MAAIDLRHATVRLIDGSSKTAATNKPKTAQVNNAGGYMSGATTFAVDTVSGNGVLRVGQTFTVTGSTLTHTITARTPNDDVGPTTSITFTPATDGAVADNAILTVKYYIVGDTDLTIDTVTGDGIILKNQQFTITGSSLTYTIVTATGSPTTAITFTPALDAVIGDNVTLTVGPRRLDVKIGEGNLTYSEKRNMEYTLDRGELDTVKEGDDVPVDAKLDATWEFLRASTGQFPTIEDVLKRRGEASGWTSSSSDDCEPYAIDVEIEYDPPCGGEEREVILLQDFRYENIDHDLKQSQLAISGKCNVKEASVSRVA